RRPPHERKLHREQPVLPPLPRRRQRRERYRVAQPEGTHRGAGEGGQVRSTPERRSQVMRQTAHVHPATRADLETCDGLGWVVVDQLEGVNFHSARLALGLLAASRLSVQRLTALLQCRVHGWHLFDSAEEAREHVRDPLPGDRGGIASRGELTLTIARVRGESERHGCQVGLRPLVHEVRESGGRVDQDGKHAIRSRIEGAAVADLGDAGQPADDAHNGKRGGARRLVDVQDAGRHARLRIRARTSASTLVSASFRGTASSIPAARRWPPPPNFAASSAASTWSRLRMLTFVSCGPASMKRMASSWPRTVLSWSIALSAWSVDAPLSRSPAWLIEPQTRRSPNS